ncbi:MAG: TonB family protein [Terracidiphilus sp.]
MRRLLVASLMLLTWLFPAAVNASQPADDSSTSTPAPIVSTGVSAPRILDATDVHLGLDTFGNSIPNDATFVVSLNVDENGKARDVQVVKSVNNVLDEQVMDAVRQFRFSPAMLDDQPVPVNLTLNVVVRR